MYHALTEEQMLDGARSHGMPAASVAYLGVLYGVVRAGYSAAVADALSHPARSDVLTKSKQFDTYGQHVDAAVVTCLYNVYLSTR